MHALVVFHQLNQKQKEFAPHSYVTRRDGTSTGSRGIPGHTQTDTHTFTLQHSRMDLLVFSY